MTCMILLDIDVLSTTNVPQRVVATSCENIPGRESEEEMKEILADSRLGIRLGEMTETAIMIAVDEERARGTWKMMSMWKVERITAARENDGKNETKGEIEVALILIVGGGLEGTRMVRSRVIFLKNAGMWNLA